MNETRLAALFAEFLDAADEGRDVAEELLAHAGDERADLEAKIRLERELRTLSRELDLDRDSERKTPSAPQLLGRFQILGSLGQGGISRVFLAFDPELDRRIALKVLDREVLLDKDQRAWILNEARSLARISHPGVLRVYEVGETATHAYVAMEHLSGPSLQEVIREWTRLRDGTCSDGAPAGAARALAARLDPFSARIELLARLAEALAYCHDLGILHRDIKPQNVLFDSEGAPKLIDFGLAHLEGADEDSRLGLTGTLVGTAAYIAPEQAASDQTGADPRSDQFAFATLAYECFALENPFGRKTRRATIDAVELADPPPLATKAPSVPPDLVRVIRHAHEREPEARYAGMAALAADLQAILESRPISIEDPSIVHVVRLWVWRHRRGVRVALAVLGLVLGVWTLTWLLLTRDQHASLLAEVDAIRPAEFTQLEQFESSFDRLLASKQYARELDQGWLRSALWGAAFPEVDRIVHAWVRELGQSYARDSQESERTGVPFQAVMYRRLLAKEEVLCRECEENLDYRGRGRVRYPLTALEGKRSVLEILVSTRASIDPYPLFHETTMEPYPLPGTYRLLVWPEGADELEFESVFVVEEGWPKELSLDLVPRNRGLWGESIELPMATYKLPNGNEHLRTPAYRLLGRFVTLGEFLEFQRATHSNVDLRVRPEDPLDAPALVDWSSAARYACWTGGRLPFAHELLLAEEARAIALEPEGRFGGEYVQDLQPFSDLTTHSWLDYDTLEEPPTVMKTGLVPDEHKKMSTGRSRDGKISRTRGVAFRIAFSCDHPETYAEVARAPLGELGK